MMTVWVIGAPILIDQPFHSHLLNGTDYLIGGHPGLICRLRKLDGSRSKPVAFQSPPDLSRKFFAISPNSFPAHPCRCAA
jgi:hypothetical protein